jgi:hypothetical protein
MATYYKSTTAGNWSSTNSWATAADGTTGVPTGPPTNADDVIFNAVGANCTIDTDTCVAKSVDLTGGGSSDYVAILTHTAAKKLTVSGNVTFNATMTYTLGNAATSAFTIDATANLNLAGKTIGNFIYNKTGGTLTLTADATCSGSWTNTAGALAGNFAVILTGTAVTITPTAALTFYNLTRTGTAVKTDTLKLTGNIAVTNALKILGNSAINRPLIASDTIVIPRVITLTAGAAGLDTTSGNFDLRDIQFNTGGADLDLSGLSGGTVGGGVVSGAGMSGGGTLTTTAAADQIYYKASGNDNWSTVGNWFLGSEGAGGAGRVPLIQDTAYFDEHSFGNDGQTITQDMPRTGSISFNGVGGSHAVARPYTFTTSTAADIYGGITLNSYCTLTNSTQTYTFMGRGSYGLTSAGNSFAKNLAINSINGTLTLQDALAGGATNTLSVATGTLNFNNKDSTFGLYSFTSGDSRYVYLGIGTHIATGSGYVFDTTANVEVGSITTGAGSIVKITNNSASVKHITLGTQTLNNLWLSPGSGTGIIDFNSSFILIGYLKDDGTANHAIKFTKSTTTTIADWQVGTAASRAGNTNVITLDTVDGAGTFTLHSHAAAPISCDYMNITRSVVDTTPKWYAGPLTHSTDGGTNTNWIFEAAPQGNKFGGMINPLYPIGPC